MKTIAVYALFAMALHVNCTAQQKSPISASISTPTPVIKSGTEVKVHVTITNNSDHTVRLYRALGPDGQAEAANQVDVYNDAGKKLSRIDGRAIQIQGQTHYLPKKWVSRTTVLVEPGQSCDDFLILSNLFDLSKPGKYTVSLRHEMRADDSDPNVNLIYATSNTITITVLPADETQPNEPK